jgi:hypothetical protein
MKMSSVSGHHQDRIGHARRGLANQTSGVVWLDIARYPRYCLPTVEFFPFFFKTSLAIKSDGY